MLTQETKFALRERVKELTCLYNVARITHQPGQKVDETLQRIVNLLPSGWQYPPIAAARITLDGNVYQTENFHTSIWFQSAGLFINNEHRGTIEVYYLEERPKCNEGPFLKEERDLIDGVARQVAVYLETHLAEAAVEAAHEQLQENLLHADRMAIIGQLAAGIAHEINEPLGSILGFAQLARKHPDIPHEVDEDLEKIALAVLYAREIIRKLMVFASQTASNLRQIDLNQLVKDSLFLFETRAVKSNIKIVRKLVPVPVLVHADRTQLNQVLVNLIVNAMQAMPGGGQLTVATRIEDDMACLEVSDSGMGIDPDIVDEIFLPFYTTKDSEKGTGLGLTIAHGIVKAHKGTIRVKSSLGRGAVFTVRLPRVSQVTGE